MKKPKPEYLLFITALVLYGASSSIYPFPDESAQLLVSFGGISPFQLHAHPLWSLLTRFLKMLPLPMAFTMNAVSVVCGALAIAVFYRVLHNLTLDSDYDEKTPAARLVMGWAGSLYLLVLMPIWMFANRAHYAAFDLMLILLAVRMVQTYRDRAGMGRLIAIGVLFALGIVESSTFLAATPIVGLYILYLMWQNKHVDAKSIAIASASFVLPLALYFIPPWLYTRLPVYEWGGVENFWHAVWMTYNSSARTLTGEINQVGWMLLLMASLIPYIGAMWVKKSQPVENRGFSILLVSLIVIALTTALLFNVRIAPWVLLPSSRTFLIPDLLIATAFAISVGFWFAVVKDRAQHRSKRKPSSSRKTEFVFITLSVVLAIVAGILNFKHIQVKGNGKRYQLARTMLRSLPSQDVIVTEGTFDRYLTIAAHDLDMDCDLINIDMASRPLYTKYIESVVETPRLASLAHYSLSAMFKEWFRSTPDISDRVVVVNRADLWQKAGYMPIALNGFYFGRRNKNLDPDTLFEQAKPFVDLVSNNFRFESDPDSYAERLDASLALLLSKNINDFGVIMEYLERPDLAIASFERALEIHSNNLSSLLNLYTLKTKDDDKSPHLLKQIEEIVADAQRLSLKSIFRQFGFVREQASIQTLHELVTAVHGSGADAEKSEQKRPPNEDVATYKKIIGLIEEQETDQAMDLCRELLQRNPSYDIVWVLLAKLAYEKEDYDTVDECVATMIEKDEFWPDLVALSGDIALKEGNLEKARNAFESILQNDSDNIEILERLVRLDAMAGGTNRGKLYLNRLLSADSDNFIANYNLGSMLYHRGKYDMAMSAYRKCAEQRPSPAVFNNMAWILNLQGRHEEALEMSQKSLKQENEVASTWDTRAMILIDLKRYEDARKALQKAREIDPDNLSARITAIRLEKHAGDPAEAQSMARDLQSSDTKLTEEESERIENILQ